MPALAGIPGSRAHAAPNFQTIAASRSATTASGGRSSSSSSTAALIAAPTSRHPTGLSWDAVVRCGAALAIASNTARHLRCRRVKVARGAAVDYVSPFEDGDGGINMEETLPLTEENVEYVLDLVRPTLQADGGDCQVIEIEGPIVRLEMQGSCSSCSSSAITLKNGIEKALYTKIPEIYQIIAELPGSEPPTEEGVEEILDSVRPFLSATGGSIELVELGYEGEYEDLPTITLGMTGPAQRNRSVKMDIIKRVRKAYAQAIVEILNEDDLE